ncbi:hypothetical protein [Bacillus benzoevorans]|uniref:NTP pyrophosphatase (Non-canonical NTP hydrolase) n=1 Tax=Bacillus benzoevorans TaxID=1456 RepID=A0A7X0LXJ5_9BACI|nr:hypothetical protein [Bacillus benzoevorans]MBB6446489.1 NTP pyrophosphatase (non-canonical NTP hydrolase) [Bacillus benzoevorans]
MGVIKFNHLTNDVLVDVGMERARQDRIHPDTLSLLERFPVLVEEVGEVGTALQTKNKANLYEELVQVAAEAVRMAEQVAEERGVMND